jgi:pimeloyl-ACP methyl ester carboxylesterase
MCADYAAGRQDSATSRDKISALAAMSRKGKLVLAAHSGHHVQLDEPDLVVTSIREVLAAAK